MQHAGASVVVTTRNRRERLALVLERVLGDPGTEEVVVVVDGSTDGSAQLVAERRARDPRIRLEVTEGVGQKAALRRGLARARGDVVLFLDDDVVPDPGLVAGHVAHHRREPGLVVVGYMPVAARCAEREVTAALYARWYEEQCQAYEREPGRVLESLWWGNVSMRRADVERVGLSDSRFTASYHHDRELGLRLGKAGLQGRFDRRLRATHLFSRDVAAFLRDADDVGRGAWLVHQLHGDVLGPFPASIWRSGARPVLQPVIGLGRRPRGGLVVPPLVIAVRMLEALRARHVAARLLAVMRQLVSERATLEQSRRRPPDAGEPRPHPVQPGRARGG